MPTRIGPFIWEKDAYKSTLPWGYGLTFSRLFLHRSRGILTPMRSESMLKKPQYIPISLTCIPAALLKEARHEVVGYLFRVP